MESLERQLMALDRLYAFRDELKEYVNLNESERSSKKFRTHLAKEYFYQEFGTLAHNEDIHPIDQEALVLYLSYARKDYDEHDSSCPCDYGCDSCEEPIENGNES